MRDLDEGEEELEAALDRWLAEEDREYIEVEEPEVPVEMIDSWCQVSQPVTWGVCHTNTFVLDSSSFIFP